MLFLILLRIIIIGSTFFRSHGLLCLLFRVFPWVLILNCLLIILGLFIIFLRLNFLRDLRVFIFLTIAPLLLLTNFPLFTCFLLTHNIFPFYFLIMVIILFYLKFIELVCWIKLINIMLMLFRLHDMRKHLEISCFYVRIKVLWGIASCFICNNNSM